MYMPLLQWFYTASVTWSGLVRRMVRMTCAGKKVVALAALTLLLAWCVVVEAPRIEAGLEARVSQELGRFAWAQVEVSGRRVVLSGAPSQGDWALARRRLQGVPGVGRIVNGDRAQEEGQR